MYRLQEKQGMLLEEQDRMQGELDRLKDECIGCRTSRTNKIG